MDGMSLSPHGIGRPCFWNTMRVLSCWVALSYNSKLCGGGSAVKGQPLLLVVVICGVNFTASVGWRLVLETISEVVSLLGGVGWPLVGECVLLPDTTVLRDFGVSV